MKLFNKNFYLFVCLSLVIVASGYSKTPSYSWSKNNIELSVGGVITRLTYNNAQDHIRIRNATRTAGYQAITKIILTLPLDSTWQINNLSKTNDVFSHQLDQWIVNHADFTQFQFSSITSAEARISVNANELTQFISHYDKPIVLNKEQKKEEKKEAKVEKKAGPPKKLKKTLETSAQMTVVRDTTIPTGVLNSQAESGVTHLAKDEMQRQLDETEILADVTYKQWMSTHTTNNAPIQAAVARNLKIDKPQWNKEYTVVKVDIKLDLDSIRKAIDQLEKESKNENKPSLSQDTTAKPPGKNTK